MYQAAHLAAHVVELVEHNFDAIYGWHEYYNTEEAGETTTTRSRRLTMDLLKQL